MRFGSRYLLMTLPRFAALLLLVLAGVNSLADAPSPDLSRYFEGRPAAFVLYDLKNDRYLRFNESRCAQQFPPFSTFKIPNSLIGLDSGAIPNADYVIRWDSNKYPPQEGFESWWRDHTLRSAFKNSAVWYYRELALRVGAERMQQYVDKFSYGNRDISGGIDHFWLNSSLLISADEQIEFLKKFHAGKLPVSADAVNSVKEIITLETTPSYKFSGKTGGGYLAEGRALGWFVGYLETKDNVYFFATQIEGPTFASVQQPRIKITRQILADLGYMMAAK